MEPKKQDLEVDFIGGEKPLTKTEEQALSKYFQEKASNRNRPITCSKVQQSSRKVEA